MGASTNNIPQVVKGSLEVFVLVGNGDWPIIGKTKIVSKQPTLNCATGSLIAEVGETTMRGVMAWVDYDMAAEFAVATRTSENLYAKILPMKFCDLHDSVMASANEIGTTIVMLFYPESKVSIFDVRAYQAMGTPGNAN